jgi:urease accessory protein
MGRFNVWATVVLSGPLLAEAAASLMSEIANLPVPQRSDLILSAAPLGEDGLLLRMAGLSTEQVSALIRQHLSFLAPHLGGELWSRKW